MAVSMTMTPFMALRRALRRLPSLRPALAAGAGVSPRFAGLATRHHDTVAGGEYKPRAGGQGPHGALGRLETRKGLSGRGKGGGKGRGKGEEETTPPGPSWGRTWS